jgi:hypothetical protein
VSSGMESSEAGLPWHAMRAGHVTAFRTEPLERPDGKLHRAQ